MRITKSMPITEWRKYLVIQEGETGRTVWTDTAVGYLIVAMEGKYWYVEEIDVDYVPEPKTGKLKPIEGEVVEMQPRLVWVGKNWLDGEDEVKVVKEGPVHGKLVWSHEMAEWAKGKLD